MLHKIHSNLDSAYYYTDYPFVRYGGKVEQGEDILVAAIREVREESGLVVNPQTVRLVGKFTG